MDRRALTLLVASALLACEGATEPSAAPVASPAVDVPLPPPAAAMRRDDFHLLLSKPQHRTAAVDLWAAAFAEAVERSNTASFAMWQAFAEKRSFVASPHSIRSALALVYLASSDGAGKRRLRSGLSYPERSDDMDLRLLDDAVHTVEPARFESVSSVWVARQRTLTPAYLDAVSRVLPAEVHSIDFAADPKRAQQTINGWVSEHTRGKIPQILEGPAITEQTRAALVNAVHFFGRWVAPFDRALTAPKPFRTAQGKAVQAQMMAGSTCSAVFASDYQAAFANYEGTSLAFVMVVPKRWRTFRWDAAAFQRTWAALSTSRRTDLELPKFSLRSRKDLPGVLDALDLDLNDPQLFEGMLTSGEALSIDLAIHEAFIQVDETATEAAAATATTAVPISASEPVPVFRVDRPFYFALVELRTGLIVLMGQVTDPTDGDA